MRDLSQIFKSPSHKLSVSPINIILGTFIFVARSKIASYASQIKVCEYRLIHQCGYMKGKDAIVIQSFAERVESSLSFSHIVTVSVYCTPIS